MPAVNIKPNGTIPDGSTTVLPAKDKDFKDPGRGLQRFSNFRQEEVGFTTLAYGHAGKAKVLQYDLGALVRKGAFHSVFTTKASIFTMDSSLAKSQMLYMFWWALLGSVSYLFMPDEDLKGMQELEKFTNYWNVFIPFILGLYISLNISRWWTLRNEGIGQVLDASQNVCLLMNGIFPGVGWGGVHDQVLKYSLASVSLIVNACRGNEDVQSLGPEGDELFTLEEMEVIDTVPYRARPVLMWTWILMLLSKVCEDYNINAGKYRDIASECKKARNGISVIWSYLRTQLPFAYVHLVTFMVNLNNFFVAIKCGILFALAVKQKEPSRALNQFFFVCIVPPLYQGLLTISFVIHDPFGEDLLDFPVMAFQEYMNEASVTMSTMGCRCPALKSKTWANIAAMAKQESTYDEGEEPKADMMRTESSYMGQIASNGVEAEADELKKEFAREELAMEDMMKDTVSRLEIAMNGQIDAKDEVIAMLRDRIKWLESSLSGMKGSLEMLEGRLQAASSISTAPATGGGFCNVQRGETAGRPVAMAPNGVATAMSFTKNP